MLPTLSHYRLELCDCSLSIRLHCEPAVTGESPKIVARPCARERGDRYTRREVAELIAATYLPHTPVEIVRVDA